ncbi:MAG: hypothetical protein PVI90_19650 [Desulfobacteraceae bacterium]|jgi:hypothetical protein
MSIKEAYELAKKAGLLFPNNPKVEIFNPEETSLDRISKIIIALHHKLNNSKSQYIQDKLRMGILFLEGVEYKRNPNYENQYSDQKFKEMVAIFEKMCCPDNYEVFVPFGS